MKIIQGTQYARNIQGSSSEICIDAIAKSDDETVVILERTLVYAVNTDNVDWRETAIANLKIQLVDFEADAQKILDMNNKIVNISADVAKEV